MEFRVIPKSDAVPKSGKNVTFLRIDHWNDYSFVTMFQMYVFDSQGESHDIGEIKIAFRGQTTSVDTYTKLPSRFDCLDDSFFSLGQSVDYYRKIASIPERLGHKILTCLRDVVILPKIIDEIKQEKVFGTSLLRGISLSVVRGQFARILDGKAELTNFNFRFVRPISEQLGNIELSFKVNVESKPSTNIHAVIGRNGVGKTTLLNGMISAITKRGDAAKFYNTEGSQETEIDADYFSSLISVSFSAFDPFSPPLEQSDPAKGTCYFYIGLKDQQDGEKHRTISDLRRDCVNALLACFYNNEKTARWKNAIEKLGSDDNFASMQLGRLEDIYLDIRKNVKNGVQSDSSEFKEEYLAAASPFLSRMSSGHAIVLLTVTRLVATVEEKSLVLLDEPESHLHPPLLSAFVRALSDLLHDRNGVAVIATHSPVVLQEIPRLCVWKLFRTGRNLTASRPEIETFGENVGVLTSEIFSLEVERSGFHDLLAKSVSGGHSYEEILDSYHEQLGFEGRAILKVLITSRDRKAQS